MYLQSYYPKIYSPSLFTPTKNEMLLKKQNKILNHQVDILITENRRLRTELLNKADINNISYDQNIKFAKEYSPMRNKVPHKYNPIGYIYQSDRSKNNAQNSRNEGLYTFQANNHHQSMNTLRKDNYENRYQRSAPKYHYQIAHQKTPERIQAKTLIDQLKISDLRQNPEFVSQKHRRLSYEKEHSPKKRIDYSSDYNNRNIHRRFDKEEVMHVETTKRTNQAYLNENNLYENHRKYGTPGDKLKNIKYIHTPQIPQTPPRKQKQVQITPITNNNSRKSVSGKKNYLSLTSKIVDMVDKQKQTEEIKLISS